MGQAMHQELFKRMLAALIGVELAVFVVSLRASQAEPLGRLLPDPDLADAVVIMYEADGSAATAVAGDEDQTDPAPEGLQEEEKLRRCHLAETVGQQERRRDQNRAEQPTGDARRSCAQCSPRP